MANTIIKGDDLMLFDKDKKSLAFATSHSLSISADAVEISSKDNGIWKANTVNKLSWEITSENLYTTTEYDKLFTSMISRTPIKVYFGVKSESDETKSVADGDLDNWSITSGAYTGSAVITSLTANANSGDNATYSVTLTGASKLVKE